MNNQEIKTFLTLQMKEMEGKEGGEAGMALLTMADYLLECVKKEPEVFQKENLPALRKVFLKVGSLTEKTKGFYDEYSEPLKEAAARIMERIDQNVTALEEQNQIIVQLEEEKLTDLEQAKEAERTVKCLQEAKEQIARRQQEAEARAERLRKENVKREADLKQSMEQQEAEEKLRQEQLEAELNRRKEQLEEQNQRFEKVMEELSGEIMKAEETNQELKAYFSENEPLKKAIEEEAYEDQEDFLKKLEAMNKQSEELMSAYDKILVKMLEDGERLQKKVKERQRS